TTKKGSKSSFHRFWRANLILSAETGGAFAANARRRNFEPMRKWKDLSIAETQKYGPANCEPPAKLTVQMHLHARAIHVATMSVSITSKYGAPQFPDPTSPGFRSASKYKKFTSNFYIY
ncbi:hypothetical protein SDJN02_02694, partial [Cucurbita argyrosperma subsp. argyrosperma]